MPSLFANQNNGCQDAIQRDWVNHLCCQLVLTSMTTLVWHNMLRQSCMVLGGNSLYIISNSCGCIYGSGCPSNSLSLLVDTLSARQGFIYCISFRICVLCLNKSTVFFYSQNLAQHQQLGSGVYVNTSWWLSPTSRLRETQRPLTWRRASAVHLLCHDQLVHADYVSGSAWCICIEGKCVFKLHESARPIGSE